MKLLALLLIGISLLMNVTSSEVCIGADEYCGSSTNRSESSCCSGLKCVLDAPHPIPCRPNSEIKCNWTYKCLDCLNEANGLCGGPNGIKCCPSYGCVRVDSNSKSFGRCLPYP